MDCLLTTSNNRYENRYDMFTKVGSFWYSLLSDSAKKKARSVLYGQDSSSIVSVFESIENWLAGSHDIYYEFLDIDIRKSGYLVLGPDTNKRIVTTLGLSDGSVVKLVSRPSSPAMKAEQHITLISEVGDNLKTEAKEFILAPVTTDPEIIIDLKDTETRYAVELPDGIIPVRFDTVLGPKMPISGFELSGRYAVFKEHPRDLFPSGFMHVRTASITKRSAFSYPFAVDGIIGSSEEVAHYFKNDQSPKAFKAALASVAGVSVVKKEGTVLAVASVRDGYRYVIGDETIYANYPHIPLVEGSYVYAGTVIGDCITVTGPSAGAATSLDWSLGLSLDGLCPFKGLKIFPGAQEFVAYEKDVGTGKFHVSMPVYGPSATITAWRAWVKAAEKERGVFLNDYVGIGTVGGTKSLDPIQVLFDCILSAKGIIVGLKTRALGMEVHNRVLDFLRDNKPAGAIVIVRET